jgi:hypothetical protein
MAATDSYMTFKLYFKKYKNSFFRTIKSTGLKIPFFDDLLIKRSKDKRIYLKVSMKDMKAEILNLNQGEWVQVRSLDKIFATLDEKGNYRGLFFMPEMAKFCGKKFKVFKKVEKITIESTGEMRKLISPTVFLEGVFCDGGFHEGCDRSCLCFWREVWLTRVPE